MFGMSPLTVYQTPQSVLVPLTAFVGTGAAVVMLVGEVELLVMSMVWLRYPPGGLYLYISPWS